MKEKREKDGFCVSQLQHWIIRFLSINQEKNIFQKDLEKEFRVSRATISSTLQVMEKNGLIVRETGMQDARLKRISLTARSLEFSRKAEENVRQMEETLAAGFSPEEKQQLLSMLRRLRRNLEERRKEEMLHE